MSVADPKFPIGVKYSVVFQAAIDSVGGDVKKLPAPMVERLVKVKTELIERTRTHPIEYYEPYESRRKKGVFPQDEFHRSACKVRAMIAGNRTGKSEAAIVDDILLALGRHPYRNIPVPNYGWIVSLDFPMSRDVAEEKVRKYLPMPEVSHWDRLNRVINFKNGSTIGFRSCDQDIEKFGGKALHWVHFDEEPPGERGRRIYQECLMRLMDYTGGMTFSLTPTLGMSWTYDEVFCKFGLDPDVCVVRMGMEDNPSIPMAEIEKLKRSIPDADELRMRMEGDYIQFSGLVYPEFNKGIHVIPPFHVPDHWTRYRSIDHGIGNPTACVWVAMNEKNEMYVYDEYYLSDKTVGENAEAIKQITGNDTIRYTTIDPSTESRDAMTGHSIRHEYMQRGVATRALRMDTNYGIGMVKEALKIRLSTGRPGIFVFNRCVNLINELTRYRRKMKPGSDESSENPVKVHDHACDALRYLVASKPTYYSELDNVYADETPWYNAGRHQ